MISESLPPRFILLAKPNANSEVLLVRFRKIVLSSLKNSVSFSLESAG